MCTTLTLTTQDGTVIHGRTDEFGMYYRNDIVLIPRNYKLSNRAFGSGSKDFLSQYAIIGTNAGTLFGEALSSPELLDDGMNEVGLSFSMLYYPGFAKYKVVKKISDNELEFLSLGRNILATCSSIDEVVAFIESYQGKLVSEIDIPIHYFFLDKSGKTLVVEPDQPGCATVYKKTNGVMTNSPNYSFHLLNLNQYVNVQQIDGFSTSPIKGAEGAEIHAHGTSGGFGVPADTSPASRFIKASYLRDTTTKKDLITAGDGVLRMFRILNNFDIIPGMSLKKNGAGQGEGGMAPNANPVDFVDVSSGHTDHTDVKDLTNGRYFYTTHNNQSPRYIEFSDYDLNGENIVRISMENDNIDQFQKVKLV